MRVLLYSTKGIDDVLLNKKKISLSLSLKLETPGKLPICLDFMDVLIERALSHKHSIRCKSLCIYIYLHI